MLAKRNGLERSLSSLVVFIYGRIAELSGGKGKRANFTLKKEKKRLTLIRFTMKLMLRMSLNWVP